MSDKSTMKSAEEVRVAQNIEIEKLQTRLKGYETVAKLANDQQKEIMDLKKRNEELERTRLVVKHCNNGEQVQLSDQMIQTANMTGRANKTNGSGLRELPGQPTSFSPTHSAQGSSSSFSILSNSPEGADNNHINTTNVLPLESSTSKKGQQEDSHMLSSTEVHYETTVHRETESSATSPEFENIVVCSNSASLSKDQQSHSISDGFIQVFPQNSQSGGSNFYSPSFDSRTVGGESCINSSRRGPMSMVGVGNGNLTCNQYNYTKGEDRKIYCIRNEGNKSITHEATPLTVAQPDIYNGTGARPKDASVTQPKKSVGEMESGNLPKWDKTRHGLMLKIPCEDSQSYKINSAPMLSYGKQESQTEISDLTSFGSTLPSASPEKAGEETGKINDLNAVGHISQPNLQASTATLTSMSAPREATQGEFVIVEGIPPVLPSMNPAIPPVTLVSEGNDVRDPNAILLKELQDLRRKTSELHMANKEWKSRWDILRKQKEDENVNLQVQVRQLTLEKESLKRETDVCIASQKEELKKLTKVKKDTDNAYIVLVAGRSQEKQLLEKLKQDYGTLHQEKRALEIQIETLQAKMPEGRPRPIEVTPLASELEMELAVVKRQVTLYMDDFNREHQERLSVDAKLQKEKEINQSLDAKLRKTHALLKSRDEDLRLKSKKAADLQYQVDELKLKLEVEQRRSSIYPSMDPSPALEANVLVAEATSDHGKCKNTHLNLKVHSSKQQKWSCIACTYENKLSRKYCEICGTPQTIIEGSSVELD